MLASQYLFVSKWLIVDPQKYSTDDSLIDENGVLNSNGVRNSLGALDFQKENYYDTWEVARQLLANAFFKAGKDLSEESDDLTHQQVMTIWSDAIEEAREIELNQSLAACQESREGVFAALDSLSATTNEGVI